MESSREIMVWNYTSYLRSAEARAALVKVVLLHHRGYVVIGGACHRNAWFFKEMFCWMMCEPTTRLW